MSFSAKDIKGAVVEKEKLIKPSDIKLKSDPEVNFMKGCNRGIERQSSVRFRFNREKLAETIFHRNGELKHHWATLPEQMKETFYISADAIIAADKDIVELQED